MYNAIVYITDKKNGCQKQHFSNLHLETKQDVSDALQSNLRPSFCVSPPALEFPKLKQILIFCEGKYDDFTPAQIEKTIMKIRFNILRNLTNQIFMNRFIMVWNLQEYFFKININNI